MEARIRRLEDQQTARAELRSVPSPAAKAPPPREPAPASDIPPWEEPAQAPGVPEEVPPLPEEPPVPEEPGQRVYDIPEDPPPAPRAPAASPAPSPAASPAPPPAAAPVNGNWWRTLSENCKGRLPPMYRPFLGMCTGVLEGDLLTVYAPDQLTLGRLDNDRVREVLSQEAEALAGGPVRLAIRTGEPPRTSPEENLKNLLQFSRQFDNIEIK